jgi:hypothetical protein
VAASLSEDLRDGRGPSVTPGRQDRLRRRRMKYLK